MNRLRTPGLISLLLFLGMGTSAAPAHAQLGGLIKKKIDKVLEKPADATSLTPPAFDERLVELTPERIDGVIRASMAAQRFNESPEGPPQFVSRREEVSSKIDALNAKYGDKLVEYKDRLSEYENCRGIAIGDIRKANKDALLSKRPPDMATIKLMTDFAQAQAAAQQRGDTAELTRLFKQFESRFDPTPAEMAELEKNCGGAPARPAFAKEAKALEDQLAQVDAAMNKALEQLHQLQEKESGLKLGPYSVALERLCYYVKRAEAKEAQQGFSSLELHALKEKYAEALKACAKGWN